MVGHANADHGGSDVEPWSGCGEPVLIFELGAHVDAWGEREVYAAAAIMDHVLTFGQEDDITVLGIQFASA